MIAFVCVSVPRTFVFWPPHDDGIVHDDCYKPLMWWWTLCVHILCAHSLCQFQVEYRVCVCVSVCVLRAITMCVKTKRFHDKQQHKHQNTHTHTSSLSSSSNGTTNPSTDWPQTHSGLVERALASWSLSLCGAFRPSIIQYTHHTGGGTYLKTHNSTRGGHTQHTTLLYSKHNEWADTLCCVKQINSLLIHWKNINAIPLHCAGWGRNFNAYMCLCLRVCLYAACARLELC